MRIRTKLGIAALLMSCVIAAQPSFAQARKSAGNAGAEAAKDEVDSEHLFGFTMGSDIGDKGDLEGEVEATSGLGKRSRSYAATGTAAELKYTVIDNFRIAPLVVLSRHDIANVTGLEDRRQFNLQGAGIELKYRVLNRENAPFGLTLALEPNAGRIDEATGERVTQYGLGTAMLFDKELVAKRIYGAFNISYDPEWTRPAATGVWERVSTLGLGAALADQVRPGLFLGGEVRYLRAYDGIALNTFAGEALFAGPTLYAVLGPRINMTLAWNMQVAGHAVGDPGRLDLVNFERHQVRVRFGMEF